MNAYIPPPYPTPVQRELHFFWLVDCSGSMRGQRIASLNQAIRESLPQLRKSLKVHPQVRMMMRAIKFNNHASWHVGPEAVPLEHFDWPEVKRVDGLTSTAQAIQMLSRELELDKMPRRGYPPICVLVSDGDCTDSFQDYNQAIDELLAKPWGKKAVRLAIAIGNQSIFYDYELLKFVSHPEKGLLKAQTPEELVNYIKWATVMVSGSVSQGKSQINKIHDSNSREHVTLPEVPAPPITISDAGDLF